ncbi:hypothetical protein CMZ84_01925 [Lysobacteraceae bacterium NML93-0399]|nr:hypothetical protein CMZ84_01925 [Xanthomonadaceae bacterium NML93-0399]
MEPTEILDEIRAELDLVEKQGQTHVPVAGLRHYLAALETDAGKSAEYRRQVHEGTLAHATAKNQFNLEMFKSVLDTGKSAIDALLIINGGAVVVLLGMLSNLAKESNGYELARYLALPLLQFGLGVLCAAATFALRYFSQDAYSASEDYEDRFHKLGDKIKYGAVAVGITGYALFGLGIGNAYRAVNFAFAP